MATASLRSIQFWQMAPIQSVGPGGLIGAVCSRMNANFSQAQWSNLFGGEEYRGVVLRPQGGMIRADEGSGVVNVEAGMRS